MTGFLAILKSFFVDLFVAAGVKIWEEIKKGVKHHESYSDGTTEKRLKKKIKDQWGDDA